MNAAHRNRHGSRVYTTIAPDAVAHNLSCLRARATWGGRTPRVWATVKGNAYGHGIANVLPGLSAADGLAVLNLEEAEVCRTAGWPGPILVYGGLREASEIDLLDDIGNLHLVISHLDQLDWLALTHSCPWIWLRFAGDLRMLGLEAQEYPDAYRRAHRLVMDGRARGVGHLSHYAAAEQPESIADADIRFRHVIANMPGPVSACNSAAAWHGGARVANTDWIRPGLALYGASPFHGINGHQLGLRPAMELRSHIQAVRHLQVGDSLGYHGAFTAGKAMRIGIVSCGYADGYPRQAPGGTPVLVNGQLTELVGQVTMDLLAVDLTCLAEAAVGDPVLLWGAPEKGVGVEIVAMGAGTIAAELLTGLTARVPFRRLSVHADNACSASGDLDGANSKNKSVAAR